MSGLRLIWFIWLEHSISSIRNSLNRSFALWETTIAVGASCMDGLWYMFPQGSGVSNMFNPHNYSLRGLTILHAMKPRLREIKCRDRLRSQLSFVFVCVCVFVCEYTYLCMCRKDLDCSALLCSILVT